MAASPADTNVNDGSDAFSRSDNLLNLQLSDPQASSKDDVPIKIEDYGFSDSDDSDQEGKQDKRLQRALMRESDKRNERDLSIIMDAFNLMKDEFIKMLDDNVKEVLCKKLKVEEFDPGEKVFDYGEEGDKLYLIWSGRVLIAVPRNQDMAQGVTNASHVEMVPLTRLDAGRAFGELALISDKPRSARVTAVKKTVLMVLSKEDYQWSLGMAQGSFLKERVRFLRSVDRSVLEDVPEVDLQAMAGHLHLESHIGEHGILQQGDEAEKVIFVKSGFCKVIRQLHPRFKRTFDYYAEKGVPPPNPFADNDDLPEDNTSAESSPSMKKPPSTKLPKFANVDNSKSVEEAVALDLGLGSRAALKKLMGSYDVGSKQDKSEASSSPRRTAPSPRGKDVQSKLTDAPGRSGMALFAAASSDSLAAPATGGGRSSDNKVVLEVLHAGQSFGVMEIMEGIAYQSSVVANPWAEVYIMTKYDLIRNTAKQILHKMFVDYKARLSDERLVQRLKQKRKWNNYKRDLWDQIREQKTKHTQICYGIDRRTTSRRAGTSDLSVEDFERVGAGEILWDKRAQTPPKPSYSNNYNKEYVFHVNCFRTEGKKTPDVVVEHDAREASLTEMEQRVLMTIATSRFREQYRKNGVEDWQSEMVDAFVCEEEQQEETTGFRLLQGHRISTSTSKQVQISSDEKKGLQQPAMYRDAVQRAQELEDKAQSAAIAYLKRRSTHIQELQQIGKERASLSSVQPCSSRGNSKGIGGLSRTFTLSPAKGASKRS